MENTYFLYHYLPALLYKLLIVPITFEIILALVSESRKWQCLVIMAGSVWAVAVVYCFHSLLPLSYGDGVMTRGDLEAMKWRDTWDFIVK